MSVQDAYMDQRLLSLPNVGMNVSVPSEPRALDKDGSDCGPAQLPQMTEDQRARNISVRRQLADRDWRTLRIRLINLDFNSAELVAGWLNDAGYVPRIVVRPEDLREEFRKIRPISVPIQEIAGLSFLNAYVGPTRTPEYRNVPSTLCWELDAQEWTAKHVTVEIVEWLRKYRDMVAWLMTLPQDKFRKAVGAACEFSEDYLETAGVLIHATYEKRQVPKLIHPAREFERALKVPKNIDLKTVERFLVGAGVAPNLSASFHWDRKGKPSVTVHVGTPMEAIGLSVHIDKNFSVRRLVYCRRCDKGFEQRKCSDTFCSARCRNYYTTKARRDKIKLLRRGEEAWKSLTAEKRKGQDRWGWIIAWTVRKLKKESKDIGIDPTWAKHELRNTKLPRKTMLRPQGDHARHSRSRDLRVSQQRSPTKHDLAERLAAGRVLRRVDVGD